MKHRVAVIGAGMGGLSAAADLARCGAEVTVFEKAPAPGGKMREVTVAGRPIDAGPTVFTMRWIFEDLFSDAGASLEQCLGLERATTLARHAWRTGGRLDLFADIEQSAGAIGEFAGPDDARGYVEFCRRSADVFRTLAPSFIAAEKPSPFELVQRVGFSNIDAMWRTAPHQTFWKALSQHFRDPRLQQLFGRYATYCGSSPWLAPATLMLVAHVEQDGVWLVRGGMRRVADAIQALAEKQGARFRFATGVDRILVRNGRACGVKLAGGEVVPADAIVFNGDVSALPAGFLGDDVRPAAAAAPRLKRSLSAFTWCASAATRGFPLLRHNVFFGSDYAREFDAIFKNRTVTDEPTVYICAQDRETETPLAEGAPERMLILVNAPADGDAGFPSSQEVVDRIAARTFKLLGDCGLDVDRAAGSAITTTPKEFAALFPGSGGALYGRASHGATATFERPGAVTRVPGLYLAGGSVHPGPGIPMAAMSGRIAAARVMADFADPARKQRRTITLSPPPLPDQPASMSKRGGRRHDLVENLG